ncbi:MAG: polyprenyl synthetase family protein [Desulfobacteraceae bacterium]|jgi:geranylgeranyl diphosphate synthase type II
MILKEYLLEKRTLIDQTLENYLPEMSGPREELFKAMRYSLFAGGKRLRPILCIAAAEAVGGSHEDVMPAACAFEMIHTYSLIHDDLPAMDDDELRRGKPTNHMVFGEAIAILAGDGLLTEAFRIMADPKLLEKAGAEKFRKVIEIVASASGAGGMVAGQALDIRAEGKKIDTSLMEIIHKHKTGALLEASVVAGAILGGGSESDTGSLEQYGKNIGLAFQISDDILDIEGDSKEMGKQTGVDIERGKNTYPSIYGMEKSKIMLKEIIDNAIDMLSAFEDKAEPLRQIAVYIIERKR